MSWITVDYFIKLTIVCSNVDPQPYSKSKLELESNLGEILPVNCKFISCSTSA